jgi:hypothetical protein
MTMTNANTHRYEDNNSGGWKQFGPSKVTVTDSDNKNFNGNEKDDGMTSYEVKTGIIEVRFMTTSGKSCNIVRSLKEFIDTARATDEEFTLMPLSDISNNLCYAADNPNSKEGIEGYHRHTIKYNNVNGTMRIHTSLDIGKLKKLGKYFRRYLDDKRVYNNKAQLSTEKGLSLGWIHKAHPDFAFRDGMKKKLQAMMNKDFKDIKYVLFPHTVNYKRSDGMMLTKNGIAIQVAKTENTSSTSF